jgi:hypothetical protein
MKDEGSTDNDKIYFYINGNKSAGAKLRNHFLRMNILEQTLNTV